MRKTHRTPNARRAKFSGYVLLRFVIAFGVRARPRVALSKLKTAERLDWRRKIYEGCRCSDFLFAR